MKIVTSRDIKNNPNILFEKNSETIITSRGRPRALCICLDESDSDNIDNIISSIKHARAKISLEKLRLSITDDPLNNNDFSSKIDNFFEHENGLKSEK